MDILYKNALSSSIMNLYLIICNWNMYCMVGIAHVFIIHIYCKPSLMHQWKNVCIIPYIYFQTPTIEEHTTVRNFMVINIVMKNACWSGNFDNPCTAQNIYTELCTWEMRQMTRYRITLRYISSQNGCLTYSEDICIAPAKVDDHKTQSTYGPVIICLSEDLYRHIKNYLYIILLVVMLYFLFCILH